MAVALPSAETRRPTTIGLSMTERRKASRSCALAGIAGRSGWTLSVPASATTLSAVVTLVTSAATTPGSRTMRSVRRLTASSAERSNNPPSRTIPTTIMSSCRPNHCSTCRLKTRTSESTGSMFFGSVSVRMRGSQAANTIVAAIANATVGFGHVTAHSGSRRSMLFPSRSEHQDLVGPLRPVRQLVERAAVRRVGTLAVGDAARVHAGAAHANLTAMSRHAAQHHVEVVIALGHLLARLCRACRVADEKHLDLF